MFVWLPFGTIMYFIHFLFAIGWMATIVGIPFGLQYLRLARLAIYPFDAKTFIRKFECEDSCNYDSFTDEYLDVNVQYRL